MSVLPNECVDNSSDVSVVHSSCGVSVCRCVRSFCGSIGMLSSIGVHVAIDVRSVAVAVVSVLSVFELVPVAAVVSVVKWCGGVRSVRSSIGASGVSVRSSIGVHVAIGVRSSSGVCVISVEYNFFFYERFLKYAQSSGK